jgi:hypothetical protein
MQSNFYACLWSLNGLKDSDRNISTLKVIQGTGNCSTYQDPKSHGSLCPGGQTANDPTLKENQLNIKWDITGQILQEDLWEGCAMQCHNEWEFVKMSDQFTLLETGPGVLQHNSKTKPLQTPSTY